MSEVPKKLNVAGVLGKMAMDSHLTPLLSVLIFIVGVFALVTTAREENPQIDVPAANVLVTMHGAAPEEVHNLIVRPLEMVLREMTGVDHTYGMALDGLGVVTVMFKVGEDKERSLVKLYDRIMHNLDRIPPGAGQPLVKPLDVDDVPTAVITLSSQDYGGLELKRLAERVRDQLSPLPGVSVADIIGGRDHEVRIELIPERLAGYRITLDQLHDVLVSANAGGPVGELVSANQVADVWLDGYLKSAQSVGRIVVGDWEGRPIYLRDVAKISDGSSEAETYHRIGFGRASTTAAKGEPERMAVSISLAKKRGTNAVVVNQTIREKLSSLRGDLIPDNVDVTITRDSGERADAAVNQLIEHLAIAVASVIVIMLIFLGWREASIVAMNIPLILFIVLAVGYLAGQTINRITLFALILSLGLLVDDAIVVIENIHRYLSNGIANVKDKGSLIIQATNETGRPTIVATIAVILAFLPMHFVTGMMGPYMGPIPFNAPVAMAASLLIAYMLTPWIARRWLPLRSVAHASEHSSHDGADWTHRTYVRLATPLISNAKIRVAFFVAVLAAFAVSLWQPAWQFVRPSGINGPPTPGTVELKMLPKGNKNTFNITVDMPESSPLEATDAVVRRIGEVLRQQKSIVDYESFVGQAGPVDFNGLLRGAVFRSGPYVAELRVNLVDKRLRSEKSEDIVLALREALQPVYQQYPHANIKLVEDPPGPPVRATLLAEIYGPHYEVQRALADRVRAKFAAEYDVVDVDDSVTEDKKEWRLKVNKEIASQMGVSTAQITSALRDFIEGYDIGAVHILEERHPVHIRVRMPEALRGHGEDLDRIYVTGSKGPLPLSMFVEFQQTISAKPILTKDAHDVVYVTGETKRGSQVYPLLDLDRQLDGAQVLPDTHVSTGGLRFTEAQADDTFSYQLLWDGEMRLTLDVFRDLGAAFIVALLLIYILMVAYYQEWLLPLLVMGPTALTLIGIFPGHFITGQPFTATSMIGMIALAGIVVRNSTLLIDYILEYRRQGHSLYDAVIQAGAVRTRPILLTALAVIAGSSIMISDPVFGGLGVSLAFGTLAATVLTLFIVPLIYFLWQRHRDGAGDESVTATT